MGFQGRMAQEEGSSSITLHNVLSGSSFCHTGQEGVSSHDTLSIDTEMAKF